MANHNLFDNTHCTFIAGQLAENIACEFLLKNHLKLIERNFTTHDGNGKKNGEIDLVMRDKDYTVFVEVKMRTNLTRGHPLEMISKPKQSTLIRTATHYLLQHHLYDSALCRFDAIGIMPDTINPQKLDITWIRNAFEVQY
ncbi:MAG: hypothetical protein ACD_42C00175G0004 [uncultured bacterium]|nr:MAG: hypothetical protein ACD_42C00175G0004 [uncultured bacterium]OGT33339.1 MAG: hypothetical protein A3C44_03900 [Gammaproteobacteria bacterium RIFCSPHIGHO2_02_FULL_39_13]OGT50280.1 MAG: hypothetical protein A3E53_00825 [Gammaproteobacteria bacterium RIFCSPHIGHO2_12_FULL_39_24]